MDTLELIKLVLIALFVGAFVPVMLQVRQTLKGIDRTLNGAAGHWNKALDEITRTTQQVNRTLTGLNDNKDGLISLVKSANDVASVARKLENSVKIASTIGAAVAPSIAAAVQAWRTPVPSDEELEAMIAEAAGTNGTLKKKGEQHAKPQ